MTALVPAALAGAAAALLVGLPAPARLHVLLPAPEPVDRPPPHRLQRPAVLLLPGLAGLAGLLLSGIPAGVLGAGAVLLARRAAASRRSERTAAQERSRAVEACSVLAGELGVGRGPAQALAAAASVATGPAAEGLAAAARAAALGGDVTAALTGPSAHSAAPQLLRALAACWQVCGSTGGGIADAVERLELAARAEQHQRRTMDSELAGPRATAGLLAVLPLGGLGLAAALGAHPLHILLHTTIGLVAAVAGLTLDGLGLLWTARLVRRASLVR